MLEDDNAFVYVQVTFKMPARVMRWAIGQAHSAAPTSGRDEDHIIAVLVAAHKDVKVVEVHTKAA